MRAVPFERMAIFTAIAVAGVLAVSTLVVGKDSLVANLSRLNSTTLGLFMLLALWQTGFRFLRWLWFARTIGIPLRVRDGILYYMAGCGMTLTPGRIGETLRLWFIEKRFGVPYRRSAALYVADRVGDADAYLILLALSIVWRHDAPKLATTVMAGVVAVNLCLFFPKPTIRALGIAYRLAPYGRKPVLWARRALRNSAMLFRPRLFVPCVALGVIGWSAGPAALVLALGRMDVHLPLPDALTVYAAAALTGGSTMLPGGGGTTEAAMVVLLLAMGVSLDAAVAATLATRLTFLWLPVGIGFAILPLALRSVRIARPS